MSAAGADLVETAILLYFLIIGEDAEFKGINVTNQIKNSLRLVSLVYQKFSIAKFRAVFDLPAFRLLFHFFYLNYFPSQA